MTNLRIYNYTYQLTWLLLSSRIVGARYAVCSIHRQVLISTSNQMKVPTNMVRSHNNCQSGWLAPHQYRRPPVVNNYTKLAMLLS